MKINSEFNSTIKSIQCPDQLVIAPVTASDLAGIVELKLTRNHSIT